MLRKPLHGAAFGAAAALLLTLSGQAAFAAAADYRFELLGGRPAGPGKTDVTLRLVHLPDAKPVPNAVIFQPLAVMEGMENMPGSVVAHPGPQPGTYVLQAATSMAGAWTLRLSAKVQGETDTVRAAVPFEAAQ